MKKKSNNIWTVITILLIVNVISVSWAIKAMSGYMGAMVGFLVFPSALPLIFIDFLVVYLYLRKQHHQGITKFIGYIIFISVGFVLTYVAWIVMLIWIMGRGYSDSSFYSFIENPAFGMVISIVATLLIVLFLRRKSHT